MKVFLWGIKRKNHTHYVKGKSQTEICYVNFMSSQSQCVSQLCPWVVSPDP